MEETRKAMTQRLDQLELHLEHQSKEVQSLENRITNLEYHF
jgi:uncharacterized coiled-coil protein SlyX